MKEQNITPEVIKLSKEIAELWRMEIYEGCWIAFISSSPFLQPPMPELVTKEGIKDNLYWGVYKEEFWFPIPSISDCLEKLRDIRDVVQTNITNDRIQHKITISRHNKNTIREEASTLHLALLSALLETLRDMEVPLELTRTKTGMQDG